MAKLRKLDEIKRLGVEFKDSSGNTVGYLTMREAIEIIEEIDRDGKGAKNKAQYNVYFITRALAEPRNIVIRDLVGYIEARRLSELNLLG